MSFLSIKNLSKSYGKVDVLHDINIEVKKGAFLVLVGPSGCGKSTLLNTIAGLETINSGDLIIGDRRVNDLRPSDRDIAMVFQSYALYPTMTVGQNMAFGMKMRKVPKEKRDLEVARVAKILKIEALLDRKPGQLSGGQRQRVAMGRALVRNPQVFLFDEPLSNLDAKLRVEVRSEIKQLHNNLKPTIVYVTHDQIEAMTLATEIAILKDGILQQVGTPHQVYTRPANLFVADFMGSPPMNLVKAKIKGKKVVIDHESGSGKNDPLMLDVAGVKAEYEGKDVIVGIRPESITDPGVATARVKKSMTAKCKIDFVEHSGADNFVFTKLGGTEVCARMSADYKVSIGGYADFVFHLDSAVLFDPKTELLIS